MEAGNRCSRVGKVDAPIFQAVLHRRGQFGVLCRYLGMGTELSHDTTDNGNDRRLL